MSEQQSPQFPTDAQLRRIAVAMRNGIDGASTDDSTELCRLYNEALLCDGCTYGEAIIQGSIAFMRQVLSEGKAS